MIILDIPRKTPQNGSYVDIPVYHRTHLGLSLDTAVHYCVLPARPSPQTADLVGSAPELIVAPFPFQMWDQLWRLTISLRDKPGLLHEISETMKRFDVNISASESTIMEESGMYHVEMIVHIPNDHQRQVIELTLLARLFDNLDFLPDGSPRLRIRQVLNLWRVKRSFEQQMGLYDAEGKSARSFWPYRNSANVEQLRGGKNQPRSLRLQLPSQVQAILAKTVATGGDWGQHLRISDTKDRFLRVLYFRASDPVIHVRVEHTDRVGAFADITRALRDASFTLLTALSTPSEAGRSAITEFVVRLMDGSANSTVVVRDRFEAALASSSCARDLALKVAYPNGYAATWEDKSFRELAATAPSQTVADTDTPAINVADLVYTRHRRLVTAAQTGPLSEIDRNRLILSNRLVSQYEIIQQKRNAGALFLSCHLNAGALQAATRVATDRGYLVVTGEELTKYPRIIDGLIEKIRSCRDFLGIWSESGASHIGSECWPSPWLLWELGVASGFHINWRLLISRRISVDAWKKLDSSRQHILYDEADFESRLHTALDALLSSGTGRTAAPMQTHYSEV